MDPNKAFSKHDLEINWPPIRKTHRLGREQVVGTKRSLENGGVYKGPGAFSKHSVFKNIACLVCFSGKGGEGSKGPRAFSKHSVLKILLA